MAAERSNAARTARELIDGCGRGEGKTGSAFDNGGFGSTGRRDIRPVRGLHFAFSSLECATQPKRGSRRRGHLSRHFIESIAVARNLPLGIGTLLDFGSGAGLPGIPIALCRPEIVVTLAESQSKKAAFLQEVVRVLGLEAKVHAQRAEVLRTVFDCVTMRAVDKMPKAVAAAVPLVAPAGWLALMTTDRRTRWTRGCCGSRVFLADREAAAGRFAAHRRVWIPLRTATLGNLNQDCTEVGDVAGELCACGAEDESSAWRERGVCADARSLNRHT